MKCPVCSFPHATLGIPCGSCGGTSHAAAIIAESATPISRTLTSATREPFPWHKLTEMGVAAAEAAIVGFAGLPQETVSEPTAPPVIVEEIVAPAVEVAAPVQAKTKCSSQPESKRTRKRAVTVN